MEKSGECRTFLFLVSLIVARVSIRSGWWLFFVSPERRGAPSHLSDDETVAKMGHPVCAGLEGGFLGEGLADALFERGEGGRVAGGAEAGDVGLGVVLVAVLEVAGE